MEASRLESEALLPEIDSVTSTYEELRQQCSKLREDINKKEDVYLKLMNQHYKAKQVQSLLENEKALLKEALGRQEIGTAKEATIELLKKELALKDKKLQNLQSELLRLSKELQASVHELADAQQAQKVSNDELQWLKKQHEEIKSNNMALGSETERCKHSAKRAEENVAILTKKNEDLERSTTKLKRQSSSSSGDTANDALFHTINELKKKVYCGFTSDVKNRTLRIPL